MPVVQYWHDQELPDYIAERLRTFHDLNPSLRHLVFNESSAAAFIAERLGPRHLRAFQACAVPAMQADYLRYCATLVLGGVYCDADFCCVADLGPLIPPPGGGRLCRASHGRVINGVFAFASPRHPFLDLALEIATVNIERRQWDDVYFTTGPPIFSSMYGMLRHRSFETVFKRLTGAYHEPYVRAYCDAIGDFSRLSDAFEGVEVLEPMEHLAFVRHPETPRQGKRVNSHWTSAKTIFRE